MRAEQPINFENSTAEPWVQYGTFTRYTEPFFPARFLCDGTFYTPMQGTLEPPAEELVSREQVAILRAAVDRLQREADERDSALGPHFTAPEVAFSRDDILRIPVLPQNSILVDQDGEYLATVDTP